MKQRRQYHLAINLFGVNFAGRKCLRVDIQQMNCIE